MASQPITANTKVCVGNGVVLDEPAAFDIEGYVVEGFACGEGSVAIFEECDADQVIAGDSE